MMDRVAIVTGGSRGIGRAIVDRLVRDDVRVITCSRSSRPRDLPSPVVWVRANVADTTDAEGVVSEALSSFGRLSLLVNNAGVQIEKPVADSTDADWDRVIGVNCRGVFNMCRAALQPLTDAGGVIVNIGSISGVQADPGMALYNASKAFVHGLTRSIAIDHGPAVRCNAICPGWIVTGMADDAFALAKDPDAARLDAVRRHPSGRLGVPADIANLVSWLASEDAAFVNGACLTVDGGLTAASPLNPGLF